MNTPEEGQMKTSGSNVFEDIHVKNAIFRAVICDQCGTKVYPADGLKYHQQYHERRDQILDEQIRKLHKSMDRMR